MFALVLYASACGGMRIALQCMRCTAAACLTFHKCGNHTCATLHCLCMSCNDAAAFAGIAIYLCSDEEECRASMPASAGLSPQEATPSQRPFHTQAHAI